jgi:hypothetical protein
MNMILWKFKLFHFLKIYISGRSAAKFFVVAKLRKNSVQCDKNDK